MNRLDNFSDVRLDSGAMERILGGMDKVNSETGWKVNSVLWGVTKVATGIFQQIKSCIDRQVELQYNILNAQFPDIKPKAS